MSRERLYPPDWLDTNTASYMVSMSVHTFIRHVDDGTLPKPVVLRSRRLWHRGRPSESFDRFDPAYGSDDGPIMTAIQASEENRDARTSPRRRPLPARRT